MVMRISYGIEVVDDCSRCHLQRGGFFCDFSQEALGIFDAISFPTVFPKGTTLFVEGQTARGIYILCQGRVKLTTCSSDGKMMILDIVEPGEALGISATISGLPYEITAEALEPCQANFVRKEDFARFLSENIEACLSVAQQLSRNYHKAYSQIRSLGLSTTAAQKLANLLLDWCSAKGNGNGQGLRLKVRLTHEEIAEMIGTSRETVSRLFKEFKTREIIRLEGSTLVVVDRSKLEMVVNP
jgi:CRP/FNR family transcriptional regulator